jgi:hypothetical protein
MHLSIQGLCARQRLEGKQARQIRAVAPNDENALHSLPPK